MEANNSNICLFHINIILKYYFSFQNFKFKNANIIVLLGNIFNYSNLIFKFDNIFLLLFYILLYLFIYKLRLMM